MKREHFIMHLEAAGCSIIRHDQNKGYSAYRSADRKSKCAVPKGSAKGDLTDSSICLACRVLRVPIPNEVAERGVFELDEDNLPKGKELREHGRKDLG